MNGKIAMKSKLAAAGTVAALMILPAGAMANQHSQPQPMPGAAALATVNWQIPLTHSAAYPSARGSAQYQSQPGQAEFQVELTRLGSLAGRSVVVSVNGGRIGSATVSRLGIAQLDRNSELGQRVPAIIHGSAVTVRTSSGALVAVGRF